MEAIPFHKINERSGSFRVDTGILLSNMKSPSREWNELNDILTLDQLQFPTD